jgi:hypothetical protein
VASNPQSIMEEATRSCVPPEPRGLGHTLLGTGCFPPERHWHWHEHQQPDNHGGTGRGHQRPTRRDALQPHAHTPLGPRTPAGRARHRGTGPSSWHPRSVALAPCPGARQPRGPPRRGCTACGSTTTRLAAGPKLRAEKRPPRHQKAEDKDPIRPEMHFV